MNVQGEISGGMHKTERAIRFGLAYAYLDGDRATTASEERRTYEYQWGQILEQVVWAESLGFDSIWFSEHHFDALCPSPMLMSAAAAARTKSVRFSSAVMLAPLYHPVRLAEEAAMVSVLSGGRYDLGIGMGYSELEYEAFGVNIRHRPSLFEEAVEIVRRAWSGKPFSFQGQRFQIPEIAVTPVPASPPRILIGGNVEAAIKRAALIGDGFISSKNAHLPIYEEALRTAGRKGTAIASQVAMIVEDPERAAVELKPYALNYVNTYVERGFVQRARFETVQEAVDSGLYNIWDGDRAVSEIASAIVSNPSVDEVLFLASSGPGEPIENSYQRIQYIMDRVVPGIRKKVASSM